MQGQKISIQGVIEQAVVVMSSIQQLNSEPVYGALSQSIGALQTLQRIYIAQQTTKGTEKELSDLKHCIKQCWNHLYGKIYAKLSSDITSAEFIAQAVLLCKLTEINIVQQWPFENTIAFGKLYDIIVEQSKCKEAGDVSAMLLLLVNLLEKKKVFHERERTEIVRIANTYIANEEQRRAMLESERGNKQYATVEIPGNAKTILNEIEILRLRMVSNGYHVNNEACYNVQNIDHADVLEQIDRATRNIRNSILIPRDEKIKRLIQLLDQLSNMRDNIDNSNKEEKNCFNACEIAITELLKNMHNETSQPVIFQTPSTPEHDVVRNIFNDSDSDDEIIYMAHTYKSIHKKMNANSLALCCDVGSVSHPVMVCANEEKYYVEEELRDIDATIADLTQNHSSAVKSLNSVNAQIEMVVDLSSRVTNIEQYATDKGISNAINKRKAFIEELLKNALKEQDRLQKIAEDFFNDNDENDVVTQQEEKKDEESKSWVQYAQQDPNKTQTKELP